MRGQDAAFEVKSVELPRAIPRTDAIAFDEKMCW